MGREKVILFVVVIMAILTGASTFISPVVSTFLPPAQEGECDECHDGFEPFEIVLDHPTEVPAGISFEFKVHMVNGGNHEVRNPYAVLDLRASTGLKLEGAVEGEGSEDISGSVSRGGTSSHQYDLPMGTISAVIALSGNSGILGRNDIDLRVTSQDGGSWDSDGTGVTEEVLLSSDELKDHGFEGYTIEVIHSNGLLSVDYTLSIEYVFGAGGGISPLEGSTIGPGDSYTFTWNLNSDQKGENAMVVEVGGSVYYEHSGSQTDSETYRETISADISVGDDYVYSSPDIGVSFTRGMWFVGRVLGFLTATSFIASALLGGIVRPIKPWLDRRIKNRKQWHCTVSYIAIFSAIVHLIVLYTGVYKGTWVGLYLGGGTFLLMALVAATGSFRRFIETTGFAPHWRRVHLYLTIGVIISLLIHILYNGSTFSFLGF